MGPIVFTQPRATAAGNISPSRFISWQTGAGNEATVVQASAVTQVLAGVSEKYVRQAPGYGPDYTYIAIANEEVPYRGPLQIATLQLGGTVNGTVPLVTNSSGQGVAAATLGSGTLQVIGALSLDSGVANDYISVYVLPFNINPVS
jgi:hypothetical protein